MIPSLQNRAALITGATRGIGKGIARSLAASGVHLTLVARDATLGEQAAAELGHGPAKVAFHSADVADLAALQAAARETVRLYGRLDILCANAGIFPSAALAEMEGDQWDEVFRINVKGLLLSVQACLPYLRESDAGRIVVTSSITGPVTGFPGWSHYGASKAAQLGFVRTAALELAPQDITINAILPGNIETEGLASLGDDYRRRMISAIPLGRLGTPADIGFAACFFASPESGFITGQTLIIDGGQILPES